MEIKLSNENMFILQCCIGESQTENFKQCEYISSDRLDWDYIFGMTSLHGLAGLIYKNIIKNINKININQKCFDLFKKSYITTYYKNSILLNEYNRINTEFNKNKINIVPLKGIYYLSKIYNDIGIRNMSDIDILIEKKNTINSEKILLNIGYVKKNVLIEKNIFHYIYVKKQNKINFIIELHWDIDFANSPFKIKIEQLWSRTEKVSNGSCFYYKFCLIDDIIFNSAHILRGKDLGIVPLKNLCDLSKLTLKYSDQIDWNLLAKRAEQYNVSRPVYIVLNLLQILFNVPIATSKIEELKKPGFTENMLKTIIDKNIFSNIASQENTLPNILINWPSGNFYQGILSFPLIIVRTFLRDFQNHYYHDSKSSIINAFIKTIFAILISIKRYIRLIAMYIASEDDTKNKLVMARQIKRKIDEVKKWLYYE